MNHYDHFDVNAFSAYRDLSVPFVTIKGSTQAEAARRAGFLDIRDLAAAASVKIGGATLHAIAANAFAPSTFRYEQCYVIEVAGRTVLFSGALPLPVRQPVTSRTLGRRVRVLMPGGSAEG